MTGAFCRAILTMKIDDNFERFGRRGGRDKDRKRNRRDGRTKRRDRQRDGARNCENLDDYYHYGSNSP